MANKYNAKKVEVDGHRFDSKIEAKRYEYLKACSVAGSITNLALQVPYVVVPKQRYENKAVRDAKYVVDFEYTDILGRRVLEDVKGRKLPLYALKRKLLLWQYVIPSEGMIVFREITKWDEPVLMVGRVR